MYDCLLRLRPSKLLTQRLSGKEAERRPGRAPERHPVDCRGASAVPAGPCQIWQGRLAQHIQKLRRVTDAHTGTPSLPRARCNMSSTRPSVHTMPASNSALAQQQQSCTTLLPCAAQSHRPRHGRVVSSRSIVMQPVLPGNPSLRLHRVTRTPRAIHTDPPPLESPCR